MRRGGHVADAVSGARSAPAAVGVDGEREPRWWWCRQARTAV
ncbi:hypothetical protein HMPREF0321_0882 [Dermacoccus sp. Ellin185]|nr:hypothetical protein HMPREF0321_0882 [Dermacoccus sp. Ellin185]